MNSELTQWLNYLPQKKQEYDIWDGAIWFGVLDLVDL